MWPCPSRNLTLALWPPLTGGDRDPPSQLERHPEPLALHPVNGNQGALTQKTARHGHTDRPCQGCVPLVRPP